MKRCTNFGLVHAENSPFLHFQGTSVIAASSTAQNIPVLRKLTLSIASIFEKINYNFKLPDYPKRLLTSGAIVASDQDNSEGYLICKVNDILGTGSNEYVVIDTAGTGTFGQVFRCAHRVSKTPVAIKVIRSKPSYYQQGLLELTNLKLLCSIHQEGSKHIVKFLQAFEHKNHVCLVFEMLGYSLLDHLSHNQFRGLPLTVIQHMGYQLLSAIATLNSVHIIHCDIKPENILISSTGNSTLTINTNVKLIDLGSSCIEGNTMHSYVQSRYYRAPEVLLGALPYTFAIDMWSVGCVFMELFLGLPLFPGVTQHNQLLRFAEILGPPPDDLIDKGANSSLYFASSDISQYHVDKRFTSLYRRNTINALDNRSSLLTHNSNDSQMNEMGNAVNVHKGTDHGIDSCTSKYRLKTAEEYARHTNTQVPTIRKYLKYTTLTDLILLSNSPSLSSSTSAGTVMSTSAAISKQQDLTNLRHCFLDLMLILLQQDPQLRCCASQALLHPFIATISNRPNKIESQINAIASSSTTSALLHSNSKKHPVKAHSASSDLYQHDSSDSDCESDDSGDSGVSSEGDIFAHLAGPVLKRGIAVYPQKGICTGMASGTVAATGTAATGTSNNALYSGDVRGDYSSGAPFQQLYQGHHCDHNHQCDGGSCSYTSNNCHKLQNLPPPPLPHHHDNNNHLRHSHIRFTNPALVTSVHSNHDNKYSVKNNSSNHSDNNIDNIAFNEPEIFLHHHHHQRNNQLHVTSPLQLSHSFVNTRVPMIFPEDPRWASPYVATTTTPPSSARLLACDQQHVHINKYRMHAAASQPCHQSELMMMSRVGVNSSGSVNDVKQSSHIGSAILSHEYATASQNIPLQGGDSQRHYSSSASSSPHYSCYLSNASTPTLQKQQNQSLNVPTDSHTKSQRTHESNRTQSLSHSNSHNHSGIKQSSGINDSGDNWSARDQIGADNKFHYSANHGSLSEHSSSRNTYDDNNNYFNTNNNTWQYHPSMPSDRELSLSSLPRTSRESANSAYSWDHHHYNTRSTDLPCSINYSTDMNSTDNIVSSSSDSFSNTNNFSGNYSSLMMSATKVPNNDAADWDPFFACQDDL